MSLTNNISNSASSGMQYYDKLECNPACDNIALSDNLDNGEVVSEIISRYRFFGHRLLYKIESCEGREIWRDVPEHFGRFYPSTIELPQGRVIKSKEGEWFARQLESIISAPTKFFRISIRKPVSQRSKAVFVNCLDPVFGHALYKLAAARALADVTLDQDVVVILSKNLLDYATFATGAIVIDEPMASLLQPSTNLTNAVLDYASAYREYRWAFCNTSRLGGQKYLPGAVDLDRHQNEIGAMVTFIHRDDRTWGLTGKIQVWRVNRLFRLIKRKFPFVKTAVIGVGADSVKYVADHSYISSIYKPDFERKLAELCVNSVCVVGVHGSHMLVPSYYAKATVELQHYSRLGNAVQAFWPNPGKNIHEILFGYRVLYGGWRLWNIPVSATFKMIESIIAGLPGLKARMDSKTIFGLSE